MAKTNTVIEEKLLSYINNVDISNYKDLLKVYEETEWYPENESGHPYHDMVENVRQTIADKLDKLIPDMSQKQKDELGLKIYKSIPDLKARLKSELPDIKEKDLKMKDFYEVCKKKDGFYESHSNESTLGITILTGGVYDSGVAYIALLQRNDGLYGVYRDGKCIYTDIRGDDVVPYDVAEAVAAWEILDVKPTKTPIEIAMEQEIDEILNPSQEKEQINEQNKEKEKYSESDINLDNVEEIPDDGSDDWSLS